MLKALLLLSAATVMPLLPGAPQSGSEEGSADVQDLQFAVAGDTPLMLDLYRPQGEPVGLIVWVHGGAWRAGSRRAVDLRGMTGHGWAVASVDYRLSPVARFPAQVHDIKAAIRYLRANAAAALGYPAAPFVIAGSSAGGHLAALVGVTNGHPQLEGDVGDHLDVHSHVQAIVDLYGASNLTTILDQSTPHGLSVRRPALELLLGGQPDAMPALAQLASPVHHVDASDPPLLLLHGDQDNQMPINQAHELEGAYRREGLRVRFDVVHGGGHGGPAFTTEGRLEEIAAFLDATTR
jgi:acetyl esterase/lipase